MASATTMKMRLRPERWAILLGLASAAMWLAGAATLAAADWKREVGTEFPGAMRSVWTLESVAREGGDLVFAVSFRNGSRSTRSLELKTGTAVAAVLITAAGETLSATAIERADRPQQVRPGAKVHAMFRFPAPAGGGSVTLRTRWTIKQSMTSDRFVEMEMPFELRE